MSDLTLLAALVLGTRLPFRSHYLYDIDSVNFALGMRRFDPTVHQPHPPGYFLYVCVARLVDVFFHDANAALVAISVAASCGAMIMIYALADLWFGRREAVAASLIFIFSPLVWFHGIVALTYAVEAFFSSVVGYLCWRVYRGSNRLIAPAAIATGLAAGFRPSFVLFAGPLLLFSVVFAPGAGRGRSLAGAGAFALASSAWFVPMISASGGLDAYWSSLKSLWVTVPAKQTLWNSSPLISIARLLSIAGIFLLCFGCAALFAVWGDRATVAFDRQKKVFIRVWIGPGLLFFTLVFLKWVNSGYLLVISPPLFVWLGLRVSGWYADPWAGKRAKAAILGGFVAVNAAVFLFAPVYCSWTAVHHFETQLEGVLRSIPEIASPADTMIVGFDSHFMGYRHAGYYLPGWFTAQFPEVRLASGIRVFAMEHGDTRLFDKLPLARFKHFLIFPLPSGDAEYKNYLSHVRARFPTGALRSLRAGNREVLFGAVTALPFLFPDAAR